MSTTTEPTESSGTAGDGAGSNDAPLADLVQVSDIPYGAPMTIPRPGGSTAESLLAGANQRSRAQALAQLGTWFPGYDFAAQAQNVDDRRFSVLALGTQLLDDLRGSATIDSLVADRDHVWGLGGISFSHGDEPGHQPPPPGVALGGDSTRGWVDVGAFVGALAKGWTAILNGSDRFDPHLSAVVAALSSAYGARININTYISQGEAHGFGPHWDTHDAIIVPVHGVKHWAIFEPNVLSPQRPWVNPAVSPNPVWEGELEPGIALVIPRGWGHVVSESDGLSIHHTIGITRLEAHHVYERVAFEAGYRSTLRADFPFDLNQPIESYEGTVFDDPQGLARETATLLTPELIERAMATFRARLPSRLRPSVTDTFRASIGSNWDGLGVTIPAPGGIMLGEETGKHLVVACAGRALRLRVEAVETFCAMASGESVTLESVPPVVVDEVDRTEALVLALIQTGVVAVRPLEVANP